MEAIEKIEKTDNPHVPHRVGSFARDAVTGFVGCVTARCVYLTGSVQIAITPKAKDNKFELQWFDEERCIRQRPSKTSNDGWEDDDASTDEK